MDEAQIRGLFFELLLRDMLKKSGYSNVQEGMVRGRGEEHEIDAYGKFAFSVPFIFPIRLLSEAKWYKRNVRLPEVRNFVGVVKDISENYFVKPSTNQDELDSLLEKRYTDCGALFSATSFSIKAQRYAYAHGIYLIPFSKNTILKDILKDIEKDIIINVKRFGRKYYEVFEETGNKKTYEDIATEIFKENKSIHKKLETVGSYVGLLDGIYPVIIVTNKKLSFNPLNPDEYGLLGEKEFMEIDSTSVHFVFSDEHDTLIDFTFPLRVGRELLAAYKKYPSSPFSYIDIPIQILHNEKTFRRIFNLKIGIESRRTILKNLQLHQEDYIWTLNEG